MLALIPPISGIRKKFLIITSYDQIRNLIHMKIKVPNILDDPIVGRTIIPFPIPFIGDSIIIEGDNFMCKKLKYKNKKYNLKDISKIVTKTKTISGWTKDHKIVHGTRAGKRVALYLVDTNNLEHCLVPDLYLDRGEKRWNSFIYKFCEYTKLPLEEINESENKS
jgi:hypothetical protein